MIAVGAVSQSVGFMGVGLRAMGSANESYVESGAQRLKSMGAVCAVSAQPKAAGE